MSERHFDKQSERDALDDFLTNEPEYTWVDELAELCAATQDLIDITEILIQQTEDSWWVDSDIAEVKVARAKSLLERLKYND